MAEKHCMPETWLKITKWHETCGRLTTSPTVCSKLAWTRDEISPALLLGFTSLLLTQNIGTVPTLAESLIKASAQPDGPSFLDIV